MRGVGARNQRQQRLANWVDRNHVAGERRAGARILGTILARANVGKISGPFGVRRHVGWRRSRKRVFLTAPFLRPEEEGLLFVRVVVVWDVDRSTQGVTEIMLFVWCFGLRGICPFFPGLRVEDFIAQIFERTPVE